MTPAYYVFRHVSQYVDPGAKRVGTTGGDDALAFKNPDGTLVAIMYNSMSSARTVTVQVRSGSARALQHPGARLGDAQHAVNSAIRQAARRPLAAGI